MTHSISPNELMIRRLKSIYTLSPEEAQAIEGLPVQVVSLESGQDIVRMGERPSQCCIVIDGFSCVYKLTSDGSRQIMAIHVPGDIPDIQSLHLGLMDFGLATLSPCTIGYIPHDELRRACEKLPRLTVALWRETLVDASIYRDWLLNIGQREAFPRVAHLICELMVRLKAVGLAEDLSFKFPITQMNLADASGITSVHMSRVYAALRADGLLEVDRAKIVVKDWERLKKVGDFEPSYLHFLNDVISSKSL
ncbi:Crp/Fnr family transcriptional regulator [Salinicola halophilus]|uniref:Crp/Fnr family transcriptional regulator n=1 Tax=Salinicola halophilus TaxID=184065 RepID=UPI000DA1C822|nr:Crp/Fnr family transcriptional regulator [Salinicola halophilus]